MAAALMRKHLTERIYSNPTEVAETIAGWTNKRNFTDEVDVEDVAAHLACWVAGEAEAFVSIDNEDNWPLIARMAELAALTMLAQRRALYTKAEAEEEAG
jgi:hypothetical protein